MMTYGIIAGSLISGSRMPLFLRVERADTQSLNGPAVKSPMNAPTMMAKLVKPTVMGLKLYGGSART